MKKRAQAVVLLSLCLTQAAYAGKVTSVYTDLNFTKCKELMRDEETESVMYRCKGLKNLDVTFWEGDLRGYVAFGQKPNDQCSAMQTFLQFNLPGPRIEWRLNKGKPIANIVRWQVSNGIDDTKHSWLAVTKLEGKNACRSALIDGALPGANAIARARADEASPRFNCQNNLVEIVAKQAVAPADLLSGTPCGAGPFRQE